ncbi:hypothetical protein ACFW9I_03250 [[Kitasatospora] papulosa]|uniref:hypothetical protein n=1 Tax=[Kitasatospora] papulosa TaxID=1464011 RepID=UPI0036818E9C
MSLTVTIVILALAVAAIAGSATFAIKSHTAWTEARKGHARTVRVTQMLVGETGCGLTLPSPKGSRPTHPDGSPYRYHEIVAEGWGHCDGCRQWGQWTAENPHECAGPLKAATTVTVHNWDDAAQIEAEIARSLRRQRRDGDI